MNGIPPWTDNQLRRIGCIGRGGFGNVFLSRCICGILMCVKSINVEKSNVRKMAEDEIKIASNLNHPNITQFFGSFDNANHKNIVMEYVSNTTIRDIIRVCRDVGYIRPESLMTYFMDILLGLEYLRTQSIIHRDIKPENLLVTRKGNIKIADFGLSIFHRPGTPKFGGTLRYMSPEGLKQEIMDYRSDIWSFGCVLYELICGDHLLGDAETDSEILQHMSLFCFPYFRVDPFRMQDGDLWADLCERMLTYNMKDRIKIYEIVEHDERIKNQYDARN